MRGCLLPLALVVWAAGCAPANREELTKDALQADPAFAAVLEKRKEVAARIETFERELALKRSTIEQKIEQLRKELAAAVSSVRTRTVAAKELMEPDRKRLELALSIAGDELAAARTRRAGLGRSVAKVKQALARDGAGWSEQERAAQEAKMSEMVREAGRLDQEMAVLKDSLRLLKVKLLLIKL